MSTPIVLGIETSCDETGIGIVQGNKLLANVISSSMDQHARFGGVVPEIAARAHLEALESVLAKALTDAKISIDQVDAVAVTNGPGLAGALMVGVGAAKALAVSLGHLGAGKTRNPNRGTTGKRRSHLFIARSGHSE